MFLLQSHKFDFNCLKLPEMWKKWKSHYFHTSLLHRHTPSPSHTIASPSHTITFTHHCFTFTQHPITFTNHCFTVPHHHFHTPSLRLHTPSLPFPTLSYNHTTSLLKTIKGTVAREFCFNWDYRGPTDVPHPLLTSVHCLFNFLQSK